MSGFPLELIFVLIFLGALLFQYLAKRNAIRRRPEPYPDEPAAQADHAMSADLGALEQATSMIRAAARPPADRPARAAPPPRARPRRRFARESLMATRRDVQDAVVIATILGPCRALEPPPQPPAGSPAPADRPRRDLSSRP